MSSTSSAWRPGVEQGSDAYFGWAAVAVLLGLLVVILGFFALMMWADSNNAKDSAARSAAQAKKAATGGPMQAWPEWRGWPGWACPRAI
jgi:hypothetical protein